MLKPGGHFSVACTTLLHELDADVNWPICMRVFMPLVRAQPMLSHIGFEGVEVDSSNSLMTYTLEVDGEGEDVEQQQLQQDPLQQQQEPLLPSSSNGTAAEADRQSRRKIHVGSDDFKHLENFDMNQLCARVILHGRKP